MLDNKDFDLWADGYDKAVGLTYEEDKYPFAGYKEVLGNIYQTVMEKQHPRVLDFGFGTATLTAKLYEQGCDIFGQDFSQRMIELASEKMPGAKLYQKDFSEGLAEPLLKQQYDYIITTYALHHLTDEQKVVFLRNLFTVLKDNGKILIGDVAFENRKLMEQCSEEAGEEWDDEEHYFVVDEIKNHFPDISFTQISHCAGILTITR